MVLFNKLSKSKNIDSLWRSPIRASESIEKAKFSTFKSDTVSITVIRASCLVFGVEIIYTRTEEQIALTVDFDILSTEFE